MSIEVYGVRPMDLHAQSALCEEHKCRAVVLAVDHDAAIKALLGRLDNTLGSMENAGRRIDTFEKQIIETQHQLITRNAEYAEVLGKLTALDEYNGKLVESNRLLAEERDGYAYRLEAERKASNDAWHEQEDRLKELESRLDTARDLVLRVAVSSNVADHMEAIGKLRTILVENQRKITLVCPVCQTEDPKNHAPNCYWV